MADFAIGLLIALASGLLFAYTAWDARRPRYREYRDLVPVTVREMTETKREHFGTVSHLAD